MNHTIRLIRLILDARLRARRHRARHGRLRARQRQAGGGVPCRTTATRRACIAIDNYDPGSQAAVLSRGLIGSLGERIVVASPIYKHHFDLRTGECLEAPEHSVCAYAARVTDGKVWVEA